MQAPIDFQNRLSRLFDDRLRIRWSDRREEWHLEYKVAPGQLANFPVMSWDDPAIRARDGYAFILAVRPGTKMPCPKCGYTLDVPVFQLAETTCTYCRLQGFDGRYPACYFPLEGDQLISHLRRLDPTNTWREGIAKVADQHNDRIMREREKAFDNHIEAATKDNLNQLMGIQSVGYTGKEKSYITGDK